jgi:8-oxo-dGTP pyrophosphatase MutT (NUDIX family)
MDAADPLARLRAAVAAEGPPTSDYDLNPSRPEPRPLREAAVLIAVEERPGGPVVWLTKRSSALRHHPGQVAFPGGRIDPGDGSAEAAALREAWEEIGLPPEGVEVLGAMPPHETVTGFRMTPVLGRVVRSFEPAPEMGEVEEAFTVPLRHLADPTSYAVRSRMWRGAERRYYAVPWGPHYVWGATARIARALADRMA